MNQQRRKTSGGQAIIMATLALLAMCGMMGLAVDLGWSFFVQKQAQAAADAAALGAVQEAMSRLQAGGGAVSSYTCAGGGTGSGAVDCEATKIGCSAVVSTSNLNNGCQYAKQNGFDWTSARQNVTMQSNDGTTIPPTAPGVNNMAYWVTVRTVQTVPQLFSSIASNTQGTVSAMATAAIVGVVRPGSFYGMNQRGDCTHSPDGPHCGTDLTTGSGKGKTDCPSGATKGSLCAPAGIILASSCNTVQAGVCDDGAAGIGDSGSGVAGGSLTIMSGGVVSGDFHDMAGNPLTPISSSAAKTFQDVFAPNSQPPLQSSSAIGTCGYPGGVIPSTVSTLGPFQYYSYTTVGGVNVPDGKAITIPDGVTFSSSQSTCPGTGAVTTGGASQSGSFPSYIFYGGLSTGDATFGPGQYVMAGTKDNSSSGTVFSVGGTITGDSSTGTMFIFTDGNYPGLSTQMTNVPSSASMPTLYQGTLGFKNADITLTGLMNSNNTGSNLPDTMNAYTGVAWWQDRRNSTVGYNEASGSPGCPDCTADNGSVVYCNLCASPSNTTKLATLLTANHVTNSSPGVTFDPGNAKLNMNGVWYQPRGGWLYIQHGTSSLNGTLQVVTGALIEDTGDTRVLLSGPTNPILVYQAALIQ